MIMTTFSPSNSGRGGVMISSLSLELMMSRVRGGGGVSDESRR